MRSFALLCLSCLLVATLAGCAAPPSERPETASPYADQRFSSVRGLSAEEIEELRTGAGMGLARPAELNGYAGPLHVLELADALKLEDGQRDRIQAIRQGMLDEAIPLGAEILEAYEALEEAFRTKQIDADSLRLRLERLAELYEELRFVHLAAHLETAPVLTQHQTMRYMELRGYGAEGTTANGDAGGHNGHAGHGG